MLDILFRSVARAGGIEVPDDVRVVERPLSRPSIVKRLADAFERWNVRRSTYLTLKQMDDRMLKDIGLHRGMLHDIADKVGQRAAANDNTLPVALLGRAANDNTPPLVFTALATPLAVSALAADDDEPPSSKRRA